jgi:hypothetical protein
MATDRIDIMLLKYPFKASITKMHEMNIPTEDHMMSVFRPHLILSIGDACINKHQLIKTLLDPVLVSPVHNKQGDVCC